MKILQSVVLDDALAEVSYVKSISKRGMRENELSEIPDRLCHWILVKTASLHFDFAS